jgi:PhnB protein
MQTITPYLLYNDGEAALDFLGRAFGFEETLRYSGSEGQVDHAEMKLGDSQIYLGSPGEGYQNPRELGQATVHLYIEVDDVDALFERATAAGAEVVEEPADQEYGQRRCGLLDPEGHKWWFAQTVHEMAPEEWGAVTSGSD